MPRWARRLVAAVAALDGPWDVLCNVAGVPGTAPPELVMKVDLLGPRQLTEAVAGSIRDGGAIVDVASTAGYDRLERRDAIRGLHRPARHPADIAAPVLFLAGPESGWLNGHIIVADGGTSGAVLSGMVPTPEI